MKRIKSAMNLFVATLFAATFLFVLSAALKEGETCAADRSCDAGLHCDDCVVNKPRCTRTQPLSPTSKVSGLPFNRYSWLTTHNAFASPGAKSATGSVPITSMTQEDSITSQLYNGVRGLMLDMYDFENDIWLCHSSDGDCYNYTAFQPAVNALKVIQGFLDTNPTEIITIIIEDYVTSPSGLTKVFDAAGLRKFWFPVTRMPKHGRDWPTVDDMVRRNHRLVVFTSAYSKEASEGIAYRWKYVVENHYGNRGLKSGSCANRAESRAMNIKTRSLVLMNHFPDNPDFTQACKHNSAPLISMMDTCRSIDGNRWPNFIAVDFYKRSDGGGAPQAVDMANGQMICGCASVAFCKPNTTFGECEQPKTVNMTSTGNSTSLGTLGSEPFPLGWCLIIGLFLIGLFMLWVGVVLAQNRNQPRKSVSPIFKPRNSVSPIFKQI